MVTVAPKVDHETWTDFGEVDQLFTGEADALETKVDLAPLDYFVEAKKLEYVRAVLWKDADEITYIWTGIYPLDEKGAAKLYQLEDDLYKKYPSARFNFYVFEVPEGKHVLECVPDDFELLYEGK